MSSYWNPGIDYELVEKFRKELRDQERKSKEFDREHYLREDFTEPRPLVARGTHGTGQTSIVINQIFLVGKE